MAIGCQPCPSESEEYKLEVYNDVIISNENVVKHQLPQWALQWLWEEWDDLDDISLDAFITLDAFIWSWIHVSWLEKQSRDSDLGLV